MTDGPSPTFIEQARRRQIVAATIEVLAEGGVRGATFARIAERAGISPSLISYHFASKAELLRVVVTDIIGDIDHVLEAELADVASHRAALRILIEAQVRYFAEHAAAVLALGHLSRAGEPGVGELLVSHRDASLRELESLFVEGQRTGDFASFPTRPMAVTLLAALDAVPGELLTDPEADPNAYGPALADIFDAAVRRR